MLDASIRRLIDAPLNRAGRALAARGVRADAVTLAGLIASLASAGATLPGWFGAALALMALGRLLDGLDGAVAHVTAPTPFGGYLDIVCDFIFYGAVPPAFILRDPDANATAGATPLFAFFVNGASVLAYGAIAAAQGVDAGPTQTGKAFLFSIGLAEGTETILAFTAILLFPDAFAPIAFGFAALCGRRWRNGFCAPNSGLDNAAAGFRPTPASPNAVHPLQRGHALT